MFVLVRAENDLVRRLNKKYACHCALAVFGLSEEVFEGDGGVGAVENVGAQVAPVGDAGQVTLVSSHQLLLHLNPALGHRFGNQYPIGLTYLISHLYLISEKGKQTE